ncbi:unnamed protein product, partial [Ectocarpus fasciculatus]
LTALTLPKLATCPSPYVFLYDGCYYLLTVYNSWAGAEAACNGHRANLATIYSAEVNNWISVYYVLSSSFWIGYNDLDDEGVWRWADGSNGTFEMWANGEPSNSGEEDCARKNNGGFTWNDVSCTTAMYGLC